MVEDQEEEEKEEEDKGGCRRAEGWPPPRCRPALGQPDGVGRKKRAPTHFHSSTP